MLFDAVFRTFREAIVATAIGTTAGAFAALLLAYIGGRFRGTVARGAEIATALPSAIIIALVTRHGVVAAIALLQAARIILAVTREARALEAEPFFEAAVALGGSRFSVLWRHVLPALGPPLGAALVIGSGWCLTLAAAATLIGIGRSTLGAALVQAPLGPRLGVALALVVIAYGASEAVSRLRPRRRSL